MTKNFNPENSTCVITGGSSGIGEALAHELLNRGAANIINLDINKPDYDCDFRECDVGDLELLGVVLSELKSQYQIDLFCSNVGCCRLDNHKSDVKHWQKVMNINFYPHIVAMNLCMTDMVERGKGSFLFTASAAGLLSMPGSLTYSTTKHAIVGLAEQLAVMSVDHNVGIHCLCPLAVETSMTKRSNDYNNSVIAQKLIGRMISAQEVAQHTLDKMNEGQFMIMPHEELTDKWKNKAQDPEGFVSQNQSNHAAYISKLFG